MPITYIAPSEKNQAEDQNRVYRDNPLPLEYALAYRRKMSGPDTLVFMANNEKETQVILSTLIAARQANKFDSGKAPNIFADQNFQFDEKVIAALKGQPQFEIILPNAVIVIKENGMAYVDPKGNDAPQELKEGQQSLGGFWIHFYHKEKDEKGRQELARKVYFHTIKQQDNNYDAIPLALHNLEILARNLNDVEALKKAKKIDRQQLVSAINGEHNPKSKTAFQLQYINEHQDEQQRQARAAQLKEAKERLNFFHESAKDRETTRENSRHAFRQDPNTAWVEVLIEAPADFVPDKDDLNKFTTTREDSSRVVNTFQLKERNIVVKSTEGEVTYKERFEQIAADLLALLSQTQSGSNIPFQLPPIIVINAVKPPSKEQECLDAFNKIFMGKSTIQINQPPSPKEFSISAALPR